MSYYREENKITFDKATVLVEEFVVHKGSQKVYVTSRDVARHYELECSHHNLIRINEALANRFKKYRKSGSKAAQFKIEKMNVKTEFNGVDVTTKKKTYKGCFVKIFDDGWVVVIPQSEQITLFVPRESILEIKERK